MKQNPRRMLNRSNCRRLSSQANAVVDTLEPRAYLTAVTFASPVFSTGVASPTGLAAANFTSSSLPDVAVAGFSPTISTVPNVAVYLNTSGSFGTPTIFPVTGTPVGITTGDFTDNGNIDIAMVDTSSNDVDVFLGDGSGNFTLGVATLIQGSTGITSIASADFNGDHHDDIAVVNPKDNNVSIYFSNVQLGQGSFVSESTISVPNPEKVITADFNHDGHPDVAVLTTDGKVYVALNTGSGSFAAPVSYSLGSTITSATDIAAADFNGDGLPDLVAVGDTSTTTPGAAVVLMNQGAGVFGSATVISSTLPESPTSVVVGSFSDSGNQDVGVIGAGGSLDILPGNGDGTFAADQSIFTNQLGKPGAGAVTLDVNGDKQPDIAFVSSDMGGIGLLKNTTNGTVNPPPPTSTPIAPRAGLGAADHDIRCRWKH